jgi:hypothetical protein
VPKMAIEVISIARAGSGVFMTYTSQKSFCIS